MPLEFPISYIGARPTVHVALNEPAALPLVTSASARLSTDGGAGGGGRPSAAVTAAAARKGSTGGGKAANARESMLAAAEHAIQFERLLVGKKDSKSFTVSNLGLVPCKWRVAGSEELPQELKVRFWDRQFFGHHRLAHHAVSFNGVATCPVLTRRVQPLTGPDLTTNAHIPTAGVAGFWRAGSAQQRGGDGGLHGNRQEGAGRAGQGGGEPRVLQTRLNFAGEDDDQHGHYTA